ncbi:MAG: hypothetical protein ACKVZ0_15480 [Gemmatimonadales bacterium]
MTSDQAKHRIAIEDVAGLEWAEWYRMSPARRWAESAKLWIGPIGRRFVPSSNAFAETMTV